MYSTPRTPAWIIRLTALEPPPPIPSTLMAAGEESPPSSSIVMPRSSSPTKSIMFPPPSGSIEPCRARSKEIPKHPRDRSGHAPNAAALAAHRLVAMAVEQQTRRRGPLGPRHDIDQAADAGGHAPPH